jgi:hypothetical protein
MNSTLFKTLLVAGYYLQTTFITFDEAEEIEGEWRLIFNRLFDRDFSTPRAEIYSPNFEGGHHRHHLWSMGVAALWSCLERTMAGTIGEQHAVVATSAVAISLDRWGCCSDPGSWDFSYLEPLLLAATKGSTRYLGDSVGCSAPSCLSVKARLGRGGVGRGCTGRTRWQRGGLLRGDGFAMVERACCVQSLRPGKQGIRCGSSNLSREVWRLAVSCWRRA